jgi:biopolymer transport protein ExbD
MARKKELNANQEVAPNLIPMVDIMFLLLLFFMLGADMGQRELEKVTLPSAQAIKEDKEVPGQKIDRLTINVYHRYEYEIHCEAFSKQEVCRNDAHWRIGIGGRDYADQEKLTKKLKEEADAYRDETKGPLSERQVMVRADASSPYGYVQDVMHACAAVGIYKIECGAARPVEG